MLRHLALVVVTLTCAASIAACQLISKSCTLVGCTDGPQVSAWVHRPMDEILDATITVCINGACTSQRPRDTLDHRFDSMLGAASARYSGGNVHDGGEGWTSIELFTPAGSFSTGDRYRLTIESATHARILDVERSIVYAISQPNGEDCSPTCHVASMVLYEDSASGIECGGAACTTRVSVRSSVPFSESLHRGALTVCRNSVCAAAEDGVLAGGRASRLVGELGGKVQAVGSSGGVKLSIFLDAPPAVLAESDVYSIRITDPQTGAVLKAAEKPASYESTLPNGPSCDTHPCRTAVIDL